MQFFSSIGTKLAEVLGSSIPAILGAFALLLVGWVVAKFVSGLVENALKRTEIDNKIAALFFDADAAEGKVEAIAGRVTFWVVMLFALAGFFQALQLTALTEPINGLLTQVFEFLPSLITAVVLVLVAVLLSRAARFLVKKGLTSIGLDKRLAAGAELEEGGTSTSTALSEAAHYLILLLFVPAILETLSLHGLLQPVSAMFETALSFVPNLVAAVAILVIGWFVARVLRQLSSALLASLGVDRLAERLGLREVTPDGKLSSALSTVIYAVVLIPVFIAALDALQLDALTEPTSQMLQQLLEAVPNILGAVLILGITWVVAKIVSELLRTLSANIGVDGLAKRLGVAGLDGGVKISSAIGHLVLAAILLFGSMEAFNTLGFELLSAMVFEIIEFASQVLLGVLILAVGLYVSQLAATVITSSRMAHSGLLATLARGAILVLAGAMALRRMGLANDIVNAAFIALLGAIAVAAALAFGLGGRQTAGSLLEEWRAALNAKRAAALESVAEPTESVSTPPVIADPTATE